MNSPILDIAIVLVFTYLLLSIMASSIYEMIITYLKARNKMLKQAINTMFFDAEWQENISNKIIESPTIKVLKKDKDAFPAYIPANSFALSIIGLLRNEQDVKMDIATIRTRLMDPNCVIKGEAKTALLNLLDTCDDNYTKFISNLEVFFNNYMDRVSGWFKLKYQKVMLLISFLVAMFLNIDSIEIANRLWKDKNSLKLAADIVANQSANFTKNENGKIVLYNQPIDYEKIDTTTEEGKAELDKITIQNNHENIKASHGELSKTGIPMGWNEGSWPENLNNWFIKFMGWIITTGAVYMGAPFWFDLLSKLVNLRGTGKKPEVSKASE